MFFNQQKLYNNDMVKIFSPQTEKRRINYPHKEKQSPVDRWIHTVAIEDSAGNVFAL
jgi:hypothetical protein